MELVTRNDFPPAIESIYARTIKLLHIWQHGPKMVQGDPDAEAGMELVWEFLRTMELCRAQKTRVWLHGLSEDLTALCSHLDRLYSSVQGYHIRPLQDIATAIYTLRRNINTRVDPFVDLYDSIDELVGAANTEAFDSPYHFDMSPETPLKIRKTMGLDTHVHRGTKPVIRVNSRAIRKRRRQRCEDYWKVHGAIGHTSMPFPLCLEEEHHATTT